ncbi:oligopeptide/dipeptide ABC transporter ATP-binding protein [Streptomyces sp. NPDC090493]|uniref:oligopeptide/dipeptide ABC transporter ATP-binding protein n=1 Tax=Streptomyces sp. NPDC090493 TaxID=3365964 RepID=UPI00380B1FC3
MTGAPLLDVRDLRVDFRSRHRTVHAVAGVSLSVGPGETVGLVGESGSGKSTLGRAILGLAPISGGTVAFDGREITRLRGRARRALALDLQVVFQDPYSSLNPALKIRSILTEPLRAVGGLSHEEATRRLDDLLDRVGLPAAADRYPGAFSGGQRQRLAIARALMPSPKLVVCDEAVSALDLSVQAQVLNLLRELQWTYGLGYLFIGHNLDVVRFMSRRVVVLYRGRVMEDGPADVIATRPRHPYTQALVAATPVADPHLQRQRRRPPADGRADTVTAAVTEQGCPFAPRCPHAAEVCRTRIPALTPAPDGGSVACHRYPDLLT